MAQKWVMLDFGVGKGVEIVETNTVKYTELRRQELNNAAYNFSSDETVTFSDPRTKKGKNAQQQGYSAKVLLFGGKLLLVLVV